MSRRSQETDGDSERSNSSPRTRASPESEGASEHENAAARGAAGRTQPIRSSHSPDAKGPAAQGEVWQFDEALNAKLRKVPRRGRGGVGTRVFDTGMFPTAINDGLPFLRWHVFIISRVGKRDVALLRLCVVI